MVGEDTDDRWSARMNNFEGGAPQTQRWRSRQVRKACAENMAEELGKIKDFLGVKKEGEEPAEE